MDKNQLLFTHIDSQTLFENPFVSIEKQSFILPNEKHYDFYIQTGFDTACILALTESGQAILVEQYRPGPKKLCIELPAGSLESSNDDPQERIKKELLEETGYTGEIIPVLTMHVSPYSEKKSHIFLGLNCKKVQDQALDETEFIQVKIVNFVDIENTLNSVDSPSLLQGKVAWEKFKTLEEYKQIQKNINN